jgi:hypothetical protein
MGAMAAAAVAARSFVLATGTAGTAERTTLPHARSASDARPASEDSLKTHVAARDADSESMSCVPAC